MFLDIATGVVIGAVTGVVADGAVVPALALWGVVFALLPDVDFVVHRLWRRMDPHFDYLHRTLLHRPLVYVPVVATLAWWWGGAALAIVATLASLWHFAHDSTGVGFGVQWLWPVSDDWIGWRHRGLAQCVARADVPMVCRVPRQKVDAYVRAQTPPAQSWIAQTYLRPSATALVEYGAVVIVVVTVVVYFLFGI